MTGPVTPKGAELPAPPVAQGHYQPVAVHQGIAYTAGMTPRRDGELVIRGRVGADLDPQRAREAAALATSNALSALAAQAGGLAGIERVLAMTVWIAATEEFTGHTFVADGGSELLSGLVAGPPPARAAVGVMSLPGGAPVEVALVAALRQAAPGAAE